MPIACYDPATGNLLGTEKSILAIYTELAALPGAKQTAIWAAFTAGTPALWAQDDGARADSVAALSMDAITNVPVMTAIASALPAVAAAINAAILNARLMMVAVYLLDKPLALKNPAFDPTINVVPYT